MYVGFGSDNHSGVHPAIIKAIEDANNNYAIAYGEDIHTEKAISKFKEIFGKNIEVFFVYNGTASNILAIKNTTQSYNSIITPETAHLNVHECCGPEKFTGCKLTTIPTKDGKLTPELIEPYLIGFNDEHMAQPRIISITQPTELGTVYKPNELKKIVKLAHEHDMLVHMDGARISNASAYLGKGLNEISGGTGIDILSFGGTKNGMLIGEAVVFFNKKHAKNFKYIRKQGMQLASKMRFLSSQFNAFFRDNLWLKNAQHANEMAQFLKNELEKLPDINITQKVQANMVFATFPKDILENIRKKYYFHVFREEINEARLMCSYCTKKDEITNFIDYIKKNRK